MEKNRLYHMYRSVFSTLLAFAMVLSCIGTALPAQASEGVEAGGAAHENRENSGEAEPELPKTHTFVFHAEGEDYLTVILKGAETLERPKNPSSENGVFAGWYVDETCTTAFTDFDVVPEMDDGTTDIYAKFTKKTIKVTYYDTEGNVILTEAVDKGAEYTVSADHPLFDVKANDKVNIGWQDAGGNEYDGTVTVSSDLELYPILDTRYWVRFDTQGGSKVLMQYVKPGECAVRPADPDRVGYTFLGWFTQPDGSETADFDRVISENLTVYAHWEANKASYIVAFWQEEADTDDYYLADTVNVSAEDSGFYTNDTATAEQLNTLYSDKYRYENFIPEPDRTVDSVMLGDGSTVVNIYYRRQRYKVTFKGKTAEGEQKTYVFENVKYGQYIGDILDEIQDINYRPEEWRIFFLFEINGNNYVADYEDEANMHLWDGTQNVDPYEDGEIVYTQYLVRREVAKTVYVYYAVYPGVVIPEHATFREYDGITFYYDEKVEFVSGNTILGVGDTDTFYVYAFTDDEGNKLDRNERGHFPMDHNGDYHLYFDRKQFDIHFVTNGGAPIEDIEDVYYETYLTDYAPSDYVELKPDKSNLDAASTRQENGDKLFFRGWYEDEKLQHPFRFDGEIMPAHDLLLYAKWAPLEYTVTFDADGGELAGPDQVSVKYGDKVSQPNDPTRGGESFLGWTLNGRPYNFDSPVNCDLTLVAWYSGTQTYHVTYLLGEGSGTAPVDSAAYLTNSAATVLNDDGVVAPESKAFVAWQKTDGSLYYPGELVTIDGEDVVLTAIYGRDPVLTNLVYDLNYSHFHIVTDAEEEDAVRLLNNYKLTLRQPTEKETPFGYRFGGWYMDEACTVKAASRMLVAVEDEPNIVYAQWIGEPAVLKYDPNGGEGEMADQNGHSGDVVQTKPNEFTRSDYRFTGWNTQPDGSGISYPVNGDITLIGEITLYAQWRSNDAPPVPVVVAPEPVETPEPTDNTNDCGEEAPEPESKRAHHARSAPQTGDIDRISLWAGVCAVSVGGMAVLALRKKREDQKN